MTVPRIHALALSLILALVSAGCSTTGAGPSRQELRSEANKALSDLVATTPGARDLARSAAGVLVFPDIVKGGFLVGGQYGLGALMQGGKTTGFYESVAASYGLQAGVQKFGYALFFMDQKSLEYLERSDGWEIGVGPSVVVVDEGIARNLTSTTLREGVYAFVFGQKGLMAGLGVQGSKITKYVPRN